MVGVAPLEGDPAPKHSNRIFMMGEDSEFYEAQDPVITLAPSQKPIGVGPGVSFTDHMAQLSPGRDIGIVQCARAGSYLLDWSKGGALFENLIHRAHQAEKHGVLRGLLWYQGEAEANYWPYVYHYTQRTENLFKNIRQELGDIPIVFVQLGPQPDPGQPYYHPYWRVIQYRQKLLSESGIPLLGMVTSKDLTQGIPYHLDQKSEIILGGRMADAMFQIMP